MAFSRSPDWWRTMARCRSSSSAARSCAHETGTLSARINSVYRISFQAKLAGGQRRKLARLLHRHHAIARHILQSLHDPRRPVDDDRFSPVIRAQSEMHAAITGRSVAHAGGHIVILRADLRRNLDPGANPVAVALGPFERDIQPVPAARTAVHPDFG